MSPLPVWARSGFTPPDVPMPHVTGAAGDIVAILTIRATLAGSTRTASVDLPDGPGPSFVDMPAPGC